MPVPQPMQPLMAQPPGGFMGLGGGYGGFGGPHGAYDSPYQHPYGGWKVAIGGASCLKCSNPALMNALRVGGPPGMGFNSPLGWP